ncbi:Protease 3 precursor [Aquisphaera giovannonii]|uniref:Protease 3 n=1 Tax=Aquisphaera giovannonii TaxID=406548 RepID=A0A5B9W450_9BACT|nr:pitrilysin family protein [Aquisphaera giovannonii]QEH34875.1 Protease 3 precursor [Aquisphaera giovannonii]
MQQVSRLRLAIPALGLAALGIALAGPLAAARGDSAPPKKITSVEGITEYQLANGMKVLLFPDPSRPKVTVNLTVFVGSRHEGYGETGMAHLLEHMVFKGTPDHPDIPGAMKERGADFNGTTSDDRTNYFETLSATDDNLEFAIKLEADRMVNSRIRGEDLATEFSVVRNEFERGENSPENILSQRMASVAFEWHNYGKSTIGNRTDIERVPVDSLRAFYRKFYQPDNAMVVVAGKFDESKALELVNKYFGSLPKPDRKLPATYTEEPPQDGERVVTLRRVGDVGLVGLLYHVPSGPHPEFPAVQVLSQILGDEPSGRLYKALVATKMASSIQAGSYGRHDPTVIEMGAEVNTKDLGTLEKVRDVMYKVIDEVIKSGVTQEEVDRARQSYLKNHELAASDPNRIAIALSNWASQGDWRLYFLNRDRVEKVTPAQVQEAAAKYLTPSNRTVGFFIPSAKPERTPVPATPDLAKMVEGYKGREVKSLGESFDVAPMAIEARVQRPQPIEGVKVALLPKKTRGDVVHVTLNLRYGTAESLKGKTDAASFLPGLMLRGTKSLSRQQIQDLLDKNFARLGGGGGRMGGGGGAGVLSYSIQTKRANLPAVLDILRQVLREPTLPEAEFEVMKNERLAALEQSRTEPTRLGINHLQRLLAVYPKDDVRYTPTVEEEIQRLKSVTIDQVREVYQSFLGASHGELAIVGDFDPSEALSTLGKALEGWKSPQPYARIERPFQPDIKPERETIETPDKANATYFAGLMMKLQDTDPDYPAMAIGNSVLGGGALSSRIADRLRQKGGLSYSAGSSFNASPLDPRGSLMVMAIYNPANRGKVVAGVDEEVARILKDGVTQAEVKRAIDGYLKQQEIQRTNDTALAGTLAENLYLGRTFQFQADLEAKVKALSVDDVNSALRKYVDPSKLSVVTAGDFKKP